MTGAAEDPHTLDEYMEALRFAAPRLPCRINAVRRVVWGWAGGRDDTELALDELVAQGRAERTIDGRYKARSDSPSEPPAPAPGRTIVLAEERADRQQEQDADVLPAAPFGCAWEPRKRNAGGGWVLRERPSLRLIGGLRRAKESLDGSDGWKWWTRGEAYGEGVTDTIAQAAAIVFGADALDQRLRAAVDAVPALEVAEPSLDPDDLPSPAAREGEAQSFEDMPPVCPGCHAVGAEPCAPGCRDAEIEAEHREAIETGDYDRFDDDDDDEPAFTEPEVAPAVTEEERSGDAGMDRHYRCLCTPPGWQLRTIDDVAAKWADPESVVASARELRPRLEAARERLRQRLSERMAVVTADRELLVELDGYSQALGGTDS